MPKNSGSVASSNFEDHNIKLIKSKKYASCDQVQIEIRTCQKVSIRLS